MGDLSRVRINSLANDLREEYLNSGQTGLLYRALVLVASQSKANFESWLQYVNGNLYRESLYIEQRNYLTTDLKLLSWFGFPDVFVKGIGFFKEPNYDAMVMAAATLLQLYVQPVQHSAIRLQTNSPKPSGEQSPQASALRATSAEQTAPLPPARVQTMPQGEARLLLVLVVKSKDRGTLTADEHINPAELIKLVDGASYWLCSSGSRLAEVREKLAVTEPLPPSDSEQEILILVTFNHSEPLAHNRRFGSKFALKEFLGKDISKVKVNDILKASRFDELMSFGFVRA